MVAASRRNPIGDIKGAPDGELFTLNIKRINGIESKLSGPPLLSMPCVAHSPRPQSQFTLHVHSLRPGLLALA